MRQLRTSASFQRRKLFCFCFFTFCLLARPELLVAPDCLISPAAGNEVALEPLLSGHWTSSWKQLVGDFLIFFLQKGLKFLHEQFIVEKPKPLKEPARFPSSTATVTTWQFLCPRCQRCPRGCSAPTRCCRDARLELSIRSPSAATE